MARFRLSRRAEADLLSIGNYTLRTWGADQAIRYVADLQTCCQMLADNPEAGRVCDEVRPDCAAWSTDGMSSSTGLTPRAF